VVVDSLIAALNERLSEYQVVSNMFGLTVSWEICKTFPQLR